MPTHTKNFTYQFKRSIIVKIIVVVRLSLFEFPKLKSHLSRFLYFLIICVFEEGTLVSLNLGGETDFGKVPTQYLTCTFEGR